MNLRRSGATSVFYKGISLRDYLRDSSCLQEDIYDKDKDTVFLDENHQEIKFTDDLIVIETEPMRSGSSKLRKLRDRSQALLVDSEVCLPSIPNKKHSSNNIKIINFDRSSTDVSYPDAIGNNQNFLPTVTSKKKIFPLTHNVAQRPLSKKQVSRKNYQLNMNSRKFAAMIYQGLSLRHRSYRKPQASFRSDSNKLIRLTDILSPHHQ